MVHLGQMQCIVFFSMTKEGYTHVLILKSSNSVLKAEANKYKISIW